MTVPSLGSGPWPTCCGRPMFFGPRGYHCAGHREPELADDGLFPAPVPAPRRYIGEPNPARTRNAVTAHPAGDLL